MPVLDYIPSYEDVRGALGLEDTELSDARIELRFREISLINGLNALDATLVTQYAAAVIASTPQDLIDAVHLYSTYKVAVDLLPSLPQIAPQQITDSNATIRRQTDDFESIRLALQAALTKHEDAVKQVLSPTTPVTPSSTGNSTHALISDLTYIPDPVTGPCVY